MGDLEVRNRKIVEDYLAALRRGAADPKYTHAYLDFWSDDIEYILPGLWPLGGVFESKAAYIEQVMPDFSDNVVQEEKGLMTPWGPLNLPQNKPNQPNKLCSSNYCRHRKSRLK